MSPSQAMGPPQSSAWEGRAEDTAGPRVARRCPRRLHESEPHVVLARRRSLRLAGEFDRDLLLTAVDLGLGSANNAGPATAIAARLGEDVGLGYDSPQLAAGVSITPAGYALFLRKILDDQLRMHDLLGADAICTNPSTCATALATPVTQTESWHYSLGHWVEDDPVVGDGAYSSPGALGFYPWISASKTYYGLLAREVTPENTTEDSIAKDSVDCGRLIRKAWLGGTPVE